MRTPNFCKVSSAAPRGARSKKSRKSARRILNASGPLEPELILSWSWANTSSTRRWRSWVSSRLPMMAALTSLRRGACHPGTQTGECIVTVPVGSVTSKILERASRMERIKRWVAALRSAEGGNCSGRTRRTRRISRVR